MTASNQNHGYWKITTPCCSIFFPLPPKEAAEGSFPTSAPGPEQAARPEDNRAPSTAAGTHQFGFQSVLFSSWQRG